MAKRTASDRMKKGVRDADDLLFIFTGKRLKDVVGKGVNLFGAEAVKKVETFFTGVKEPPADPNDPYVVLGLHPGALDIAVKGAYRSLAREFHPDSGKYPDGEKMSKINAAYNSIMEERKKGKEGDK